MRAGGLTASLAALRSTGARLVHGKGRLAALAQTAFAQSMIMALNLATGVLTARLLGPTGRGEFAAASIWLMIPSLLATAGLQSAIVYEGRLNDGARRGAVTVGALGLATVAFLPMALACLPIARWLLHSYGPVVVETACWALVLSLVNVWVVVARQSLLAARDFGTYNLFTISFTGFYLILLILAGASGYLTPQSAIWCQLGGTALMLGMWLPRLASLQRRGAAALLPSLDVLGTLARYALRAAPADMLGAVAGQLDRLILVGLIAPSELGLYAASASFARVLSILQATIGSVMLADLSGRPREEIALFARRSFHLLLWTLVACCCSLLFVDKYLLHLAYGPAFTDAVPVFRVLLVEASFACLCSVLAQVFLASGRPATTSTSQAAAFSCSTAGMFVLAPTYGALGAAAALLGGSVVRLVLLLVGLRGIDVAGPGFLPRRSDFGAIVDYLRATARTS